MGSWRDIIDQPEWRADRERGTKRAAMADGYALSSVVQPPVPLLERTSDQRLSEALACSVKWPNDALVPAVDGSGGLKTCGILAEAANLGDDPAVVVGMGLNVSLRRDELPVPHATSLELNAYDYGIELRVNREQASALVIQCLRARLEQWASADPQLVGDYVAACATIGSQVRVMMPGDVIVTGSCTGIAPGGQLTVRDSHGVRHQVSAGDVTHVRPA